MDLDELEEAMQAIRRAVDGSDASIPDGRHEGFDEADLAYLQATYLANLLEEAAKVARHLRERMVGLPNDQLIASQHGGDPRYHRNQARIRLESAIISLHAAFVDMTHVQAEIGLVDLRRPEPRLNHHWPEELPLEPTDGDPYGEDQSR
ncbi:hypothetical protein [Microbispora sp. NPDC049125]|uniref:hypothetical protein n=1 Tax=Microbispora sp. NPDC049125 TaxID=3154929 RepID=UPI0034651926